ncbi:MAG: nitroreductase/quinone reductase family protein [Pseudonocardia sp.]|nr:nitroreductase/quinone reductase family protein [Pseudonocardia sp.]
MGAIEQGPAAGSTARGSWHTRLLRWMYRDGRPNPTAKLLNRWSAAVAGWGWMPSRLLTLEVVGRRSGRTVSLPLVPVRMGGERYLVCMLGPTANWVLNVEAAGGSAVLRHGRRERVRLVDVPVEQRAPVVRRYLELAPGARPHMPVSRGDALDVIAAAADRIPVFRITGP